MPQLLLSSAQPRVIVRCIWFHALPPEQQTYKEHTETVHSDHDLKLTHQKHSHDYMSDELLYHHYMYH